MRPVAPRVPGCEEITLAEDQLEYASLVVAVVHFEGGGMGYTSRWRLSDEERAKIARGEDLYLNVMTFGNPMQPVSLSVGLFKGWEQPGGGG